MERGFKTLSARLDLVTAERRFVRPAAEVASRSIGAPDLALFALMDRLEAETGSANWDGEGGIAIGSAQWRKARSVVACAAELLPRAARPYVSSCGDGTVHLIWFDPKGNRGLLEIAPDALWWTDLPIDEGEEPTVVALSALDEVFGRVRLLQG